MIISPKAWEKTQYNLGQDFINFLLPPSYAYPVETSYPRTVSMESLIKGHCDSLRLPEQKLLRLEQLSQECSLEKSAYRIGDWATLFTYDVLQGFGHMAASDLGSVAFDGLRELANTSSLWLGRELQRVFGRHKLLGVFGDLIADVAIMFRQLPAEEFGEAIRESLTPTYLRAGEMIRYELALLNNDQASLKESLTVLEASETKLEREINNIFLGHSTEQIGTMMKRLIVGELSQFKEAFSHREFTEKLVNELPTAFRSLSWYIGRRLYCNLQYDPDRTIRLLEAINHHKEIVAVFELYHYNYGWRGDRTKAIRLGWQAVAPKYFHLSRRAEDIHEDEGLEKFIGVAQGLEDYTKKNPAIDALTDGFLGKLGAYLMRAAKNEETDYFNKKRTDGNIALTDALHSDDLRHPDREVDEELSDDEILSREKQKNHPLTPIAEDLECKETLREWFKQLTDKERKVVTLMMRFDNQQKVAGQMEISQQRVSQLLLQASEKLK